MAVFLIIIIVHFIADFIFQAEEWALNKSKNNIALLKHVSVYSTFWVYASCLMLGLTRPNESTSFYVVYSLVFAAITFVAHFTTDYFTSRVVSRKFANKQHGSPVPNFGAFTMIGFDQVLHYTQLLLTLELIVKFA